MVAGRMIDRLTRTALWRWWFTEGRLARFALMRLLPRISRRLTSGLLFTLVVQLVLPQLTIIAIAILVGSVPGAVRFGMGSPPGHRVVLALVLVAVLFIADLLVGPLQSTIVMLLGQRLDGALRGMVMEGVARPRGIAHLEDPDVIDKITQAQAVQTGDVAPSSALQALASLVSMRMPGFGSALLLFGFNPLLAVGLAVVCLGGSRLFLRGAERTNEVALSQVRTTRRSGYYSGLLLDPEPGKEVRILALHDWGVERFQSTWLAAMSKVWRQRLLGYRPTALGYVVLDAAQVLGMAWVAWEGVSGRISLTATTMYVQAVSSVMGSLGSLTSAVGLADRGSRAVPSTLEVAATRPDAEGVSAGRGAEGLPRKSIHFDDVSFAYPRSDQLVLAHVDLDIPAGESLALVGANGAGKTTLVKLLCGLYQPTGGRILVDDHDLGDLDPSSWQTRIGAIFQDFVQYHLPARENVGLGAIGRIGDEEALNRAVERAGARDIIDGLSHGWDTVLSRQYEGGTDLSGGQWQRIALARALFAIDGGAGVLVMDEPTANLDVRAEAELYERFLSLTQGVTTVLISHRFSTVRLASHICVLDDGRIVEQGSHDELMDLHGRYARMFSLQASRFGGRAPEKGTGSLETERAEGGA